MKFKAYSCTGELTIASRDGHLPRIADTPEEADQMIHDFMSHDDCHVVEMELTVAPAIDRNPTSYDNDIKVRK